MKGKKYIYDEKLKKVVEWKKAEVPATPSVRITASNRLEGAAVRTRR